jgi:putative ABC transport system permease protein
MYPQLTPPLLVALAAAAAIVFVLALRPVLRRLALRQVVRRPTESVLVVLGSVLGTALIVASLVVGDSLDRSVRQTAYDVMGPVDEYVRSASLEVGDAAAARLESIRDDPRVDGLLTVRGDPAAAVRTEGAQRIAEPRAIAWEVDFAAAARFGAPHPSGLAIAHPRPGQVVINELLGTAMRAQSGDRLTFFLYGRPTEATIAQIVPAEGLAGIGLGASANRDAFFPPGTLTAAARAAGREPTTTTFVSNRGGVETGEPLTGEVTQAVRDTLGPLTARGAAVATPKRDVLAAAEQTADALGSLFLFVSSFSIIAGVMLLVMIFVMLADERKGQLGILRALGMRRRRVTGEFAIEGAIYSVLAALLGAALGLLVARVVVTLAITILNQWQSADNKLALAFAVTPVSVVNGIAAGFLIGFLAVVLTSVRIARVNIIAAIRDLETSRRRRTRRRWTAVSAAAAALLAAASVPAVASSAGAMAYLLPALTVLAAVPLLRRFWGPRPVHTVAAFAVLGWGLLANLARPDIYDDGSTTTYIVLGVMLSFAAVVLISEHQAMFLRPLQPLIRRPSQTGLAARLAVAYPTAKRFRTGSMLAMYAIVMFVIVVLTQISAIINAGVGQAVTDATAGWTLRADHAPSASWQDAQRDVTSGRFAGRITQVAPLLTASAEADDPRRPGRELLPVLAIGVPPQLAGSPPEVADRLPTLPDGNAAWALVLRDAKYVLIDALYGATGGPQVEPVQPGATITLTDPRTGRQTPRTVAAVLKDGTAFYGVAGGEFRYPVLMSQQATRRAFGVQAQPTSMLLRTAPQVAPAQVAADLQGEFLPYGLVATDLRRTVEDGYAASTQFFRLMQGYLALGLLVGITGLGVVMVRSVRERRRTIGVLRALGFRARTVQRSFLIESSLIAVEGVTVGAVLGVLNTWLLYQNSAAFGSIHVPFPIAWAQIWLTVGATLVASLLATIGPARRAARIQPAIAVRVAD